jgi:flagellar hook-associated protein 2
MSDVFVPGLSSRFNTDKLVEDMMRLERVPRDRAENNLNSLESQRSWWQDVSRRITALRDSSRALFSFQNPFTGRAAFSSDDSVITATTTREAAEQESSFVVRQLAQADRFLSSPMSQDTQIDAGNYAFTVGANEINVNFAGGTIQEFADAVSRQGGSSLRASLMTVQPGTRSLMIESRVTGAENRLGFSGDSQNLALQLGIIGNAESSTVQIPFDENTVKNSSDRAQIAVTEGTVALPALSSAQVPLNINVAQGSPLVLRLETATVLAPEEQEENAPPPGPDVPSSGSVTHAGITVYNQPSSAPMPEWMPPSAGPRVDDLGVLSLVFSDGTSAALPAITDSEDFSQREYSLAEIAGGKTIVALNMGNASTNRDVMLRSAVVLDPNAPDSGMRPLNAVSTAQDAVIAMDGIEMRRPTNVMDDIIPGVTITARNVSDRPVRLNVQPDREVIKDSIITMVGNYNRLMAEINVLTRTDPTIVNELTYLSEDEAQQMMERLGAFSSDSSLGNLRNSLMRTVSAPYPTDAGRDLALLSQIGISTNAQRTGGIDQSRLRGYLEIDEVALDAAIENNLPAVRQLFGSNSEGGLLINTGVAFNIDSIGRPFVETGGIISIKTGTIDSRIRQDTQRIATLDRQLASKESALRVQFAQMEQAFSQMEEMSGRFDSLNNSNQQR